MEHTKHHVREVILGLTFHVDQNSYLDSIGALKKAVEQLGFSLNQELKTFQADLKINLTDSWKAESTVTEGQANYLFQREGNQFIRLSQNNISLHWTMDYPGWEIFQKRLMQPVITILDEVHPLYAHLKQAEFAYLNDIPIDNLADVRNILKHAAPQADSPHRLSFFSVNLVEEIDHHTRAVLRAGTGRDPGQQQTLLRMACTSVSRCSPGHPQGIAALADTTHHQANQLFRRVATDQFLTSIL